MIDELKDGVLVCLTLTTKDYKMERGVAPLEIRVAHCIDVLGWKVCAFFADTDRGYHCNWPQRRTACDILEFAEYSNTPISHLVLDNPQRFMWALHPYLRGLILAKFELHDVNDILSEATRYDDESMRDYSHACPTYEAAFSF